MFTVIVVAAMALIAVGLIVFGTMIRRSTKATGPNWLRIGGFIVGGLAGVVLAFSVFTIVPTKQVGIPVTFGKPGDAMSNGLHAKAPWTSIVLMDATVQPLDATGDKATIAKDADKSDVFVHNNVRWAIKEGSAPSLYVDYKEFDKIGDLLVQPALRTSVAEIMSTYHPLAADQPGAEELGGLIKERLQKAVGDRVVIHSVGVTLLDFSEATKNRINALNIERGNTAIAEQKAQTAAKEAEANRVLAESVSEDPNVLVSKCLDMVAEKGAPAGFQCWPGQADGQSVIVNGAQ